MSKVIHYIREHLVEFIGFIVVIFLINLITFIRFYSRSYVCTKSETVHGIKTIEKYEVTQRNNHIKKIHYDLETTFLNKKSAPNILDVYTSTLSDIKSTSLNDNNTKLKFFKNKLYLSYDLTDEDIKDNKAYRTTKVFIRNIKSTGFKCK